MRIACLTGAMFLMFAGQAVAGPLDPKHVAGDAQWVVHVDFDHLREGSVAKFIREKMMANEHIQERLKKFQEDSGVDPHKDMHSITLWDNRYVEHSGVAVVRASHIDHDKLVALLKKKHPDFKKIKHGDHDIYTWKEGGGKRPERSAAGAFAGDEAVVFSRDAEQVGKALDVLDGKAEGLSADSPLAAASPAGTTVIARGIRMDQQKTPFKADAIRKSKQLMIAMGHHDDDCFAEGTLTTADAKTADQIKDVVEGGSRALRALAELRFGKEVEDEPVLKNLKVTSAEDTVSVKWQAKSDDVVKAMAKHHERMEKMQRWHKERQDRLHGKPDKEKRQPGDRKKKSDKEEDDD